MVTSTGESLKHLPISGQENSFDSDAPEVGNPGLATVQTCELYRRSPEWSPSLLSTPTQDEAPCPGSAGEYLSDTASLCVLCHFPPADG